MSTLATICKPDTLPRSRQRPQDAHGVAIAGAGMITPIGATAKQTWTAILRGDRIFDHSVVQRQWGGRSRVAGLAIDAAREAIADAAWSQDELHSAALVIGTSKGPIVDWINNRCCGSGVADLAKQLADELGLHTGPRLTLSAACASGLHALIRGALLIKSREAGRVLVVAAEASFHDLFLSSFRRLGVLAKPGHPCRPFDQSRTGFLMSEAGAAVCLEAVEGETSGSTLIEKMAIGGDASHLITSDEHTRTLRRLLDEVIDCQPVDLVHAHGTGTIQNDELELRAIEEALTALGGPRPALYSHKAALGHSLGAAGLISVVINRICHETATVPPGLAEMPIEMRGVTMTRSPHNRNLYRSVAIAAGFGGAVGAVSLLSQ
jgi:3-oxoacyl-[acyl-carrier-protein] synthase II